MRRFGAIEHLTARTGAVMAKKVTKPAVETDAAPQTPVKATAARNTTVPPKAKSAKTNGVENGAVSAAGGATTHVSDAMIAERAYHLWKAGSPGSEHDHWVAAERELRGK